MIPTMLSLYILCCCLGSLLAEEPSGSCFNRFEYEYNVLQKILHLETKASLQEGLITALTNTLKDTTSRLNDKPKHDGRGSTYIRWGRTSCPEGGALVYHGYATGSLHTNPGSGANRLCLPTDPMWNDLVAGFQPTGRLYGSEYEVANHPFLKHLHDEDVPCAVCRIPRSPVLMIPGRYECYDNFTLEYSGYLMSGYYGHKSLSEYVCVDDKPDTLPNGQANDNEALFYLVETVCGSLPCPPYADGREVTCAVCSYAP